MRKLFILFTFLSVSLMGFAEAYCEKVVTTTIDYTSLDVKVTVKKQSATTVRVILDNEHITGIRAGGTFQQWGNGVWENQDDAVANFAQGWTQSGTAWSKDFVFSTYPTTGNFQIYILMDHDAGAPPVAGFTLTSIDIDNDCSAPVKTDPALNLNSTAETLDATAPAGTFQISASQSGDGAISYESSNPGIASVSNDGLVTAVGRGTATITVSTAETATYAPASKTLTVTVTGPINWAGIDWLAGSNDKYKLSVSPEISDIYGGKHVQDGTDLWIGFPSAAFGAMSITPSGGVDAAWRTFALSNFPNQENQFTVECGGTTYTFDVYFADGTTGGGSLSESDLTRTSSAAVVLDVAATSSITHTTSSTGAITYTTSDPSVASVSNSGVITAQAFGEATITVSQVADASYEAGSFTVAVSVNMPKKASVKSYGSLRMTDVQLYDIAANVANISNPCGKVDLYVVTFGNDIVYKAIVKDDKAFEDCTDYFCQLRTWKSDMTTMKEQCALQCSGDLKTRTLVLPQATRYEGLSFYDSEMKLTSYMALTGCGARTMKTVSYTRDYVNNVDESDVTAPVLGAATVTPGVDDITVSFDAVTSEEVFYLIEDAAHNKKFCSFEPSFTLAKDGSGVTYNYSCYAIDYNGNVSAAQTAVVEMPFDGSIDLALNQPCEAGCNQNENTNASKANDGLDTNWETGGGVAYENQWWYVDLGDTYNLDNITIRFENARSNHFLLQGRTSAPNSAQKVDDNAWNVLKEVSVEPAGDYALNEYDVTGKIARYVRFKSLSNTYTNAYGCKIREFCVYGTSIAPVDAEAPSMTSASLVSGADTYAVIAVTATDNQGIACFHVEEEGNSFVGNFVAEAGNITVTGLTEGTSYTLVITAVDFFGNESANSKSVSVTTTAHYTVPQTAASEPTVPADQVKSIYSDAYSLAPASINDGYYNEGWWAPPVMTEENISGDHYLHYNLAADGMIGWQFAEISVNSMEKLHIDIFSSGSGTLTIRPITTGGPEVNKTLTLVGQQWNSFDIALTEFPGHDWTKLFQFAIEHWNAGGLTGEHISVDNVYFYRESALVDSEAPTNFSASRAEESFFSVKINAQASDNSGAVIFTVKNGDDVVATQNAVSAAATVINVTGLNAGTAYNFNVYVADEAGNTIDPIAVAATTKALPSAAPVPTLAADMVKSIYSETYTTAITGGINFNEGWWQAPTIAQEKSLEGNNARYYGGLNTNGVFGITWSGDHKLDAADYQIVHFHIYPTNSATIEIYPVIQPEGEFHRTSQTLVGGQWNEVVIDYSDKTFAPFNQFGVVYTNVLGDFFIDNLFFEKSPNLVRDDSWMAPGELGTICIPNGAIAKGGDIYELVGKNSEGKIVFATVPNNQMTPGKPYLFEATSNAMKFYYTAEDAVGNPVNTGAMKGTFADITLPDTDLGINDLSDIYYFADHALWSCADISTLSVPANRAYVKLSEVNNIGSSSPAPGRRYITMGVNGKDAATGFDQLNASDAPMKMIIDGQLFILRGEKLYDATGRLVK